MAKRQATHQLTRENEGEEQEDTPEPTAAPAPPVGRRPIKGLPRRALGGARPAAAAPAPTAPAAAGSAPQSGFSFGAPAPAAPAAPAATSSAPVFSFSSAAPPASGKPQFSFNAPSTVHAPPPATESTEAKENGGQPLVSYFTQLRGLNASLVRAVEKAIAEDPFADLAPVLKTYASHRAKIEESKPSASSPVIPSAPSAKPAFSFNSPTASAPAAAKPPSRPPSLTFAPAATAPKPTFNFKPSRPSQADKPVASAPKAGEERESTTPLASPEKKPKAKAPSAAPADPKLPTVAPGTKFTFGGKSVGFTPKPGAAASAPEGVPKFELPKGGFSFADKPVRPPPAAEGEGKKAQDAPQAKAQPTTFAFIPPSEAAAGEKASGAAEASTKKDAGKPAFSFGAGSATGSNLSGTGFGTAVPQGDKSGSAFSFGAAQSKSDKSDKPGSAFSFGSATPSSGFGKFTGFGSAATPAPKVGFGTAAPSNPAAGSSPPPVGFGFGNSPTSSFEGVSKPGKFTFSPVKGGGIKFGDDKPKEEDKDPKK